MLLVWCHLLTGYEPELVHDNLCKMVPRPPLLVVQVHGERVSSKGYEFEPLSVCTLYTCGSVAGQLWVRESVRYITHDSCAISVVPPFNMIFHFYIINVLSANKIIHKYTEFICSTVIAFHLTSKNFFSDYNKILFVM